jgi:hypothetical protein
MSKQTSTEWLMPKILELTLQLSNKRISQRTCELKILNLFEQAKEMEKQQIINACDAGFDDGCGFIEDIKYKNAEQYYKETYQDTK